jgi:hypothetical protein
MSKDKEVVVQVNVKPDGECELDEICLDELLDELKYDDVDEEEEVQQISKPKPCCSFAQNFVRSWTRPKPESQMVFRFKKLAGIINDKIVASLTLPSGERVEFKSLPHWWDVVRYKIAGFKYETYLN